MEPVKLKGSIAKFGARRAASGDKVKSITIDVFGDFSELDALMDKPLRITLEEDIRVPG